METGKGQAEAAKAQFIHRLLFSALCLLILVPAVMAFDVVEDDKELPAALKEALENVDFQKFDVRPQPTAYDYGLAAQAKARGWPDFAARYGKNWRMQVDSRTRAPLLIEGKGIPWVPGKGNKLKTAAFGKSTKKAQERLTLADIGLVAEGFIEQNQTLLQVKIENLILDEKASRGFGKQNRYWSLRYQYVFRDPRLGIIPVKGAYLFFRVNHGNLIQFGNQLAIAPQAISSTGIISQAVAINEIKTLLERPKKIEISTAVVDVGQSDKSLQIVLFNRDDGLLGHRLVRSFYAKTPQWSLELWLDAHSGELVYAINKKLYVDATVSGGIYPVTNTDPEVLRGLPFLNVVNNGVNKDTDQAGVYDYAPPGSLATATLEGDFIRIDDSCGDSALATSINPGDLNFGRGAGTDCETPGFGGDGNTHASRNAYYHLNLIKEKARSYLNVPVVTTPWLDNQLITNINVLDVCNAAWDGTTGEVEFYRSGTNTSGDFCSNTGEIAGIFLHEFGHGLDDNTNGAPPENGSGEAYGDTMAFLQTHDACIGNNFKPGIPCQFGCAAGCTGVRDVDVAPEVTPATIENAPADCDRWDCPYSVWGIWPYRGPMGYEGHCESLIASGAVWDMIQGFIGRYGDGAGWALGDRIWYESLYDTGSAYQVTAGGTCNTAATVDGCAADNWYTAFLAIDDDNGDLTDGTPNADLIWDAFNNHGIACGAAAPPVSTTCPALAAPVLVAAPADGQVQLDWDAIVGAAAAYRIFRNEFGCDHGFTPIAEVAGPATTYTDTAVSNGTTYYYAVQAMGADDICVSGFSACVAATPPAPLQPANIFMVLDQSGSMSGSTDVAGERKIDALQDASDMVVDLVSDYAADGFRVGAVAFSTDVTGDTGGLRDPSDMAPGGDRQVLDDFITALSPTNLTAIGLGMNAASGAFPVDGNQKVIMLLSDGMQNVAPMLELQAPPPGVAVGGTPLPDDIRFYTVALGTNIQEDLFDDLAHQGGIPGFYYSGGTVEIQNNFAFWAADVLGLEPAGAFAPLSGSSGLVSTASTAFAAATVGGTGSVYYVNRTVRRVTFLVTWQDKGRDLRFYLDSPVGRIDPPNASFHAAQGYASYTVHFPLPARTAEAHIGQWILQVYENGTAANRGMMVPPSVYSAHALFDDPALSLDYVAGSADPGAGEAIPVAATVLENGNPLSGLNVKVVVVGPQTGLGDLLSEATVPDRKRRRTLGSVNGDRYPDAASEKLALLLAQNPDLIPQFPDNVLTLSETMAGVYSVTLPASLTEAAGTYELTFLVAGPGKVNAQFQRTQYFSRYLRLKPSVDDSKVITTELIEDDTKLITLTVTPRDTNHHRLGPGWANYIKVTTSIGVFSGDVVDNLNGSYTLQLRTPINTNPHVLMSVRGEPVVDNWVNNLLDKNLVSLHAGFTMPRGYFNNNYDPGLSFILDFEHQYSKRFSSVALLGYNRFNSGVAGVADTYWWNISANVKYLFSPRTWRPYLNGGVGYYIPKSGANKPGLNFGVGVAYVMQPNLSLEMGIDHHRIFTSGTDTKFLAPHVGLVYRY